MHARCSSTYDSSYVPGILASGAILYHDSASCSQIFDHSHRGLSCISCKHCIPTTSVNNKFDIYFRCIIKECVVTYFGELLFLLITDLLLGHLDGIVGVNFCMGVTLGGFGFFGFSNLSHVDVSVRDVVTDVDDVSHWAC